MTKINIEKITKELSKGNADEKASELQSKIDKLNS